MMIIGHLDIIGVDVEKIFFLRSTYRVSSNSIRKYLPFLVLYKVPHPRVFLTSYGLIFLVLSENSKVEENEGNEKSEGKLVILVESILFCGCISISNTIFSASPPSEIFMPLSERVSNCKYGLRDAYETEEKSISTWFEEDDITF
ncbi:unnamed protein product [Rhizophagus irregularis]|nr:unnamed protein product [Rhizophagus irregularis]